MTSTASSTPASGRGKFIVFEGIDGSGKGTQMKKCASFLFDLDKDNDVYLTREPTRDFKEIRKAMAAGKDVKDSAEWYAEMFVKDRRNHIDNYIEPALARGTHVVCDRYKHSTLAYQHTQGLPLERLQAMHEGMLVPDLTLIFDCDVATAFKRRHTEGATDVFEKNAAFQESLRATYVKLKDALPAEPIVIIRADRPIEEIASEVQRLVQSIL
jgi:dTMP kinase